ncbi:hypothetical protein BBJ28_00020604 [Nothophytophthora sp. Chile5]|nr:hypothetical protein BBJ28_00020604 [Nothophytophthora sp. Chile5]
MGDCRGATEHGSEECCVHSSRSIQHLLDNNKKWREELVKRDSHLFERTSEGQHPPYLWIGCSDSRVPPEEITGLDPGEMFVHRNVANLMVNNDQNALSVVQFAVETLKVKDIIVCGHYGCGGVRAAMENKHIGLLDNWLRSVRDICRLHKDELALLPADERYHRVVELNVQKQCLNIFKTNMVQHRQGREDQPSIHGLVYDIHTGALKELEVDYCGYISKHMGVESMRSFMDNEFPANKFQLRRGMILDLFDGLEDEAGLVRIRYMARMLKRETELFSPEEVDEAIEAIKGKMEDPMSPFVHVKALIQFFAPGTSPLKPQLT